MSLKGSFDWNRFEEAQQAPISSIGFQPGLKIQLIAQADFGQLIAQPDFGQFSTHTCSSVRVLQPPCKYYNSENFANVSAFF